jgi:hypothetical protein
MSAPPNKRRRTTAIGPDSAELAKAFTHKTITTTNRSGLIIKKDVLVPLVPISSISENATVESSSSNVANTDIPAQEYGENVDIPSLNDYDDGDNNRTKSKVCTSILN